MNWLRRKRRMSRAGLIYSATARCMCGAGLAYRPGDDAWDCSMILLGRAIPRGVRGAWTHTDRLPFAFYKIKAEGQPSARGQTTRIAQPLAPMGSRPDCSPGPETSET